MNQSFQDKDLRPGSVLEILLTTKDTCTQLQMRTNEVTPSGKMHPGPTPQKKAK